jgi:DnaJ-class molecular chaperone
MATHYNVLGVKYLNHVSNIKKAYRKLALKHHPDKGGIAKNFRRIQEAYEVLSNEGRRNEYDIELEEKRRVEELEKRLEADRLEAERLETERQKTFSKTRKNSRNHIMSAIRRAEDAEARAYNMIKRAQLAQEKASALLGKKSGGRSFTRKYKNRKH